VVKNLKETFNNLADGHELPGGAAHTPASWIKITAETNGTFTVTNSRNGFSKTYGRELNKSGIQSKNGVQGSAVQGSSSGFEVQGSVQRSRSGFRPPLRNVNRNVEPERGTERRTPNSELAL